MPWLTKTPRIFLAFLFLLAYCVGQSVGGVPVTTQTWVQAQGYSSLPSGLIFISLTSCPAGFSEVTALNGKMLRGTLAANGDVGTTGGNSTITPSGSVQQATFTGSSVTTSAVSAGTPSGTNSTTTTGGTAITATATTAIVVSTGTGNNVSNNTHTHPSHTHTVPAETFTGAALPTHTHTDTAAGTINAQNFTGTPVDPSPPFTKVIFCSKN